jgi:arylsulfatase A-like enzyme
MIRLLIVCAAAAATTVAAQEPLTVQQPNIIFAFSDEHRWHAMGHTAMPNVQTPNMDRMALEGVAFDLCVSNYPVCSPYRAMLMTGRWPHQNGVIDNNIPLNPDAVTLGDLFRKAGYSTGYIGKWHLGGEDAKPYGFDYSTIWTNTNTHFDESDFHTGAGEPEQPEGYNATLMTDQANAFIRLSAGTPFFLMLSWNPPHSDYLDAPEDMNALYDGVDLPYRENVVDPTGDENARKRMLWSEGFDDQYRGYHAHVSAVDRELGRLMETVEELGLRENTIIVYSSDHGVQLGSHGVGSKRQPYDESILVPYLFWGGPITFPGRRIYSPVGTVDILPTLCGLAGIGIPKTAAGRDLAAVVAQGALIDDEPQLIMHISKENASHGQDHPAPLFRGLRAPTHTYVLYPDGREMLFDNVADLYQINNLADDREHRARKSELRRTLGLQLQAAYDRYVWKGAIGRWR